MEQKMNDDEFEKLLKEIGEGVAQAKEGNQYLQRDQNGAIKLTFPLGNLEDEQPRQLAQKLLDDISLNPRNSIFEKAVLPEGYGFEGSLEAREKLINNTQALDGPREEIKKFYRRTTLSGASGFFLTSLAMIPAPIVGGAIVYLGLAAAYPPLLIATTVVLGAAALIAFGVAAYSKWKETKARSQFETLYDKVVEDRDTLRNSLENSFKAAASKGLEVEKGDEENPDLTSSYTKGTVFKPENVGGQGQEDKEPESTITKTLGND